MMQLKNCGEYLDVVPHHQVGKYHVWVSGAVLCREPGPGTGTASLELVNYSSLDPNIVSVQWKDWFVSFVTLLHCKQLRSCRNSRLLNYTVPGQASWSQFTSI